MLNPDRHRACERVQPGAIEPSGPLLVPASDSQPAARSRCEGSGRDQPVERRSIRGGRDVDRPARSDHGAQVYVVIMGPGYYGPPSRVEDLVAGLGAEPDAHLLDSLWADPLGYAAAAIDLR